MKKIPVRRTITAAYHFAFAGLEKVIALIWLPVILITVGDYFASGAVLSGKALALDSGDVTRMGPVVAHQLLFSMAEVVLVCVIGIAICREILSPLENRPSFLRFSLGGTELRAAGGIMGVYLLMVLVAVIGGVIGMILSGAVGRIIPVNSAAAGQQAVGFAALVVIVLLPILLPLFVRLSYFIFPAVLTDNKMGLEESWKLAKGNVWRIILISLAVALPPLLVGEIASGLVLGVDSLNMHLELWNDKAALDRIQIEQARQMAAHLPLLKGIEFVLAPFFYGLIFSAPAFAYKFLKEQD